ncbi:MAG: type I 3-dehydroquinate dehydratase [Planctomycetota bacterium]
MLCVSLIPHSLTELKSQLRKAARLSFLIELRADRLPITHPNRLPVLKNRPIIFTCRPRWAGGFFKGSETARIQLLQSAIDSNRFDYVDVEYGIFKRLKRPVSGKTRIILSDHNFKKTPNNLNQIYQKLSRLKPDVIKIVTMARDISDNLKIFKLHKYTNRGIPLIAFCMGEDGLISRVLYKKFGFWIMYAPLEFKDATGPGQIPYFDLKHLYRADRLNKQTKIYGLIGQPVAHSLSPLFFNHIFKQKKINAVYLPFRFKNLKSFKSFNDFLDVLGYSVTAPYKTSIMRYLNHLTPLARRIGAVNTIYPDKIGVYRKGPGPTNLIGTNTDAWGAWQALEQAFRSYQTGYDYRDKTALIIGAGGAARAIAFWLRLSGMRLIFVNRHYLKAKKNALDFKAEAIKFSSLPGYKEPVDLIINATPLGTWPRTNITPLPKKFFKPGMIVFDAIYNPPETRFLREAKEKGCLTVSGLGMFLYQADAQLKLFLP